MSDAKSWIEERRVVIDGEVRWFTKLGDAHKALDALNAVNTQIDRMEADANAYGDGGHDLACDALFAYVMTLRQAIEGALNDD